MARVHGLKHVERLGAAALADHDPVRPHSKCVPEQVANAHLAVALDVRWPGFERDDVHLLQAKLGRVFDGDDALACRDVRRQRVQERRFSRAAAARDDDIETAAHTGAEELQRLRRDGRMPEKLVR